jgi:hypothetical protein
MVIFDFTILRVIIRMVEGNAPIGGCTYGRKRFGEEGPSVEEILVGNR